METSLKTCDHSRCPVGEAAPVGVVDDGEVEGVDGAGSCDDDDCVAGMDDVVDDEVARGSGAAGVVKREQEARSPAKSRAMTRARRLVLTPLLLMSSTIATVARAVKACDASGVIVTSPKKRGTARNAEWA